MSSLGSSQEFFSKWRESSFRDGKVRAHFVLLRDNDDLTVFYDFHLILGEEGNIVVVTELVNGNDGSGEYRLLKMCPACWAVVKSSLASGMRAQFVASLVWPLATCMDSPSSVC